MKPPGQPGYLSYCRYDGTPDQKVIEDFANTVAGIRKAAEKEAMRKLKQALTDAEMAKLLEQLHQSK